MLQVNSATQKIVLNSVDISISSASFVPDGGREVTSSSIDYEKEQEKVTIQFPDALAVGKSHYKLNL